MIGSENNEITACQPTIDILKIIIGPDCCYQQGYFWNSECTRSIFSTFNKQ